MTIVKDVIYRKLFDGRDNEWIKGRRATHIQCFAFNNNNNVISFRFRFVEN